MWKVTEQQHGQFLFQSAYYEIIVSISRMIDEEEKTSWKRIPIRIVRGDVVEKQKGSDCSVGAQMCSNEEQINITQSCWNYCADRSTLKIITMASSITYRPLKFYTQAKAIIYSKRCSIFQPYPFFTMSNAHA